MTLEELKELLVHQKEKQRVANQQILLIKREIKRKQKANKDA
jgi:hypothetical protein